MSDKTDLDWVKNKFEELVVPSLMELSNLNKKTVISELWSNFDDPVWNARITKELFNNSGEFLPRDAAVKVTSIIKTYNEIPDRTITANTINSRMTGVMSGMQENKPAVSFEDWPLTNNSYGYPPEIGNGFIAMFRIPDQGYNLGWIIYRGAWILGNVELGEARVATRKGTSFYLQGGDLADNVILSYEEEPWLGGMLEAIFDQCPLVYGWTPAPSFFQTLNWRDFPSVVL